MAEAMTIARNFKEVHSLAQQAGTILYKMGSIGGHFIDKNDLKTLQEADAIIDKIRNKSNEWEAQIYATKTLTENPSLT